MDFLGQVPRSFLAWSYSTHFWACCGTILSRSLRSHLVWPCVPTMLEWQCAEFSQLLEISFHREVSGGGRAKVPDPNPIAVLVSLHTVLPLPIWRFLISFFMTASSFWTNCLAYSSFLNHCTISFWIFCLAYCSFLNLSSILELTSSLRFTRSLRKPFISSLRLSTLPTTSLTFQDSDLSKATVLQCFCQGFLKQRSTLFQADPQSLPSWTQQLHQSCLAVAWGSLPSHDSHTCGPCSGPVPPWTSSKLNQGPWRSHSAVQAPAKKKKIFGFCFSCLMVSSRNLIFQTFEKCLELLLDFQSREWATHGLLIVTSTGVPWVSLPGPTCVLLSPGWLSSRAPTRACVALVVSCSNNCGVLERCRSMSAFQQLLTFFYFWVRKVFQKFNTISKVWYPNFWSSFWLSFFFVSSSAQNRSVKKVWKRYRSKKKLINYDLKKAKCWVMRAGQLCKHIYIYSFLHFYL